MKCTCVERYKISCGESKEKRQNIMKRVWTPVVLYN